MSGAAPRVPVAAGHASRLINHGPTVLVGSAHGGRRNVMAAAWSMPVEFAPPRIAVVIDRTTFTRELVRASGAFSICVPCAAQADLVWTVGSLSGREPADDKFERLRIGATPGPVLGLPWVDGCIAWMECRVIAEPHAEAAYDTFFAEVVAAQADARVFSNGRWTLDGVDPSLRTLHHFGGGTFVPAGAPIRARRLDAAGGG